MTKQTMELLEKAMALSERERAELASSLLESLDTAADPDAMEAWSEEVAGRVAALDAGQVKTVSWDEVRNRAFARLSHESKHR